MKAMTAIFVFCCLLVNTAAAEWNPVADADLCVQRTGNDLLDIEICGRAIRYSVAAGLSEVSQSSLYSTRGRAYTARREFKRAIADFDFALRLNAASASAYNLRGAAYHGQGDFELALADYARAIELFPHYAEAYRNRGTSYYFAGDAVRAAAAFSRAIALNAADPQPLAMQALVQYQTESFAAAARGFARLESMQYPYKYLALWTFLAYKHAGLNPQDLLAVAAAALEDGTWPGALIGVFRGYAAPETALAAARTAPAELRSARLSEAQFYLGELSLLHGDRERAAALFRATATAGFVTSIEHRMATSALRRLK